jgi:hypothetical protein
MTEVRMCQDDHLFDLMQGQGLLFLAGDLERQPPL